MENTVVLRKVYMQCPLCDKVHEVEERTRSATITIKGESVLYPERYFFCVNSNINECEFETGSMTNENLMAARNEYRKKHNLLTSDEIVEIRENYGLTQVELARLLGWGEATISRYESKAIQDETYDNMLRIIREDPLKAIEFLDKNKDKFVVEKRLEIRSKMLARLEAYGKEFHARQRLSSEYAKYTELSDLNGYKKLDIGKIECIITYYANNVEKLYKAKLMRMLWYADAIHYKKYGHSMTGLVYRNEKSGVLPVGQNHMINLENINVYEEETEESTKYYIYPNEKMDTSMLSTEDKGILDAVVSKFKDFNSADLASYMREESAYRTTRQNDIISYALAKDVNEF